MALHKNYDENESYSDFPIEADEEISHRKQVRKMLEERLERKRLKDEFDELDGEFDWDEDV